MDVSQEKREELIEPVAAIIYRFEKGEIAVYQEANDLIKALGGEPIVEIKDHAISVLSYLNALLIRALLEPEIWLGK